ncbi:hypothetical protein Pmani_027182 [Petrolisthes manimaculis]|uniref:Carboxylic ester hydrolase n=1 Tax=Petrolisthes manimaculis TaxID=1843537 RepID=A0AAE1P2Q6_9EUCA|nr:hypothetical protein Pmani_027182 [Petrolisthes manimaculis]
MEQSIVVASHISHQSCGPPNLMRSYALMTYVDNVVLMTVSVEDSVVRIGRSYCSVKLKSMGWYYGWLSVLIEPRNHDENNSGNGDGDGDDGDGGEPPVGSLRFKPPQGVIGWDGLLNTTTDPPMCLQPDLDLQLRKIHGSEDCLYLNVYTPADRRSNEKLAVMVFIHGGAFFCGASSMYTPYTLLDRDVILVTLQYRLGILGFLSTEDEVLPGNLGLLDQTEGLRWVQRNIQGFGGDVDTVTIFGESAGGASVHYHILSPLTKGLFSGAIMQSGSALDPCHRGGSFRQVAELVGHELGCPHLHHTPSLLTCLRKAPAQHLAATIFEFFMFGLHPVLVGPRVDGVYLPQDPALLIKEARHHHIPLMSGITSHEGAMTTANLYSRPDEMIPLLTDTPEIQLASLELREGDLEPTHIATRVFRQYMGGPHFDLEHAEAVTQLYGDRMFVVGEAEVSQRYSQTALTFTYHFTHRGQHSLTDLFALGGPPLPFKWVCHGDELLYLYSGGPLFDNLQLSTPDDLRMRQIMVSLWVNFATTRNPTPDDSLGFTWTPYTPADPQHLTLTPNPTMTHDNNHKVLEFWRSLPLKDNLVLDPAKVEYQPNTKEEL